MEPRSMISSDWAIKSLLRQKANFGFEKGKAIGEQKKALVIAQNILKKDCQYVDIIGFIKNVW